MLGPAGEQTVTVSYGTAGGTATEGTDYDGASGTLTFAPGDTEKIISVQTREDETDEPDETFTVTLSNPNGATLQGGSQPGRSPTMTCRASPLRMRRRSRVRRRALP